MTPLDLSSGLSPDKEAVVAAEPSEPFWAENMLFCPYDPKSDIAGWLHLGTVPNDWSMWEDRVLLALPGDEGLLTMWAYHRTAPALKPAGANLRFECLAPFERWRVTFDGFADHVSQAAMTGGGLAPPSGRRRRLIIDLEVESVGAVWDAEAAAHAEGGRGDMASQGWAKEHYEQLYRARGEVKVDDRTLPFDGMGWRDHSRGPRGGGGGAPWGGHVVVGAVWPNGKSAIFECFWTPQGDITLEAAVLMDASGRSRRAAVVEAPRLRDLVVSGEKVRAVLRAGGEDVRLDLTCDKSIWVSMQNQLAVGVDRAGPGLMYALNFGPCVWDGVVGHFYLERSDPLSLPPIVLKA